MLRGGGFLESDGLLKGLEPSQVVSRLLSRVSSGGKDLDSQTGLDGGGVIFRECGVSKVLRLFAFWAARTGCPTRMLIWSLGCLVKKVCITEKSCACRSLARKSAHDNAC